MTHDCIYSLFPVKFLDKVGTKSSILRTTVMTTLCLTMWELSNKPPCDSHVEGENCEDEDIAI